MGEFGRMGTGPYNPRGRAPSSSAPSAWSPPSSASSPPSASWRDQRRGLTWLCNCWTTSQDKMLTSTAWRVMTWSGNSSQQVQMMLMLMLMLMLIVTIRIHHLWCDYTDLLNLLHRDLCLPRPRRQNGWFTSF